MNKDRIKDIGAIYTLSHYEKDHTPVFKAAFPASLVENQKKDEEGHFVGQAFRHCNCAKYPTLRAKITDINGNKNYEFPTINGENLMELEVRERGINNYRDPVLELHYKVPDNSYHFEDLTGSPLAEKASLVGAILGRCLAGGKGVIVGAVVLGGNSGGSRLDSKLALSN